MYSCVSFIGVLLLLLCTPLGFIRLFGVVGQVLVKPTTRDINEELHASYLEEASVIRKLENIQHTQALSASCAADKPSASGKYCDINSIPKAFNTFAHSVLRNRLAPINFTVAQVHATELAPPDAKTTQRSLSNTSTNSASSGSGSTQCYNSMESDHLYERLRELTCERKVLDKLRKSTGIQRNFIYPFAMLTLLFLTGITILTVVQNTLELLIGIKALPLSTRVNSEFNSTLFGRPL